MSKHLDRILAQGVVTGLLKPVDAPPAHIDRPWPLTVFTGICAWFAAIPIAIVIYLIAGGERSPALGILSAVIFCVATIALRSRPKALFLEQLSLAGLVASALALAIFIETKSGSTTASATLFFAFGTVAWLVPQGWLRTLLGSAVGALGIFTIHHLLAFSIVYDDRKLWALLAMSAFWCVLCGMPSSLRNMPVQHQARIEALILGIGAALVCSPFWVNEPFIFFETSWRDAYADGLPGLYLVAGAASTLASTCYMAIKWPPLRAAWFAVVSVILVLFTWYIPSLSMLAIVGAVSLTSGRRALAILCGIMLVWWIGNFYYSLRSPLIDKAVLLAASGFVLALTTAFLVPTRPHKEPIAAPEVTKFALIKPTTHVAFAILGCAVLTLGIANVSIMQKEALARTGTTLFVELKPVDPRSLMQGDYMRLSFGVGTLPPIAPSGQTALVGTVDEAAVWTVSRHDDGTPLAAGEVKINLSGTPSHPIFVTDAWFFKEGEAHRWEAARYGEFRVDPNGEAVLITLRGKNLEKL